MANDPLSIFAPQLMYELAAVGLSAGGRRETREQTLPPGYEGGSDLQSIRLSNGQILWLALDVYREDPFEDERWYGRAEVRGAIPRIDRSILAAVSVFEGSELSRSGRTKENPEPTLSRIRCYLRGEQIFLKDDEERLLDLARAYVQHYRIGLDEKSEEGNEILVETCRRASRIVEATRQLTDYLTFGRPGADTVPEIKDAQLAVEAAELFHIEGVRHYREIGRRLGLEPAPSDLRKGGHSTIGKLIDRGEKLFKQFLGEEGWRKHVADQHARLKQN